VALADFPEPELRKAGLDVALPKDLGPVLDRDREHLEDRPDRIRAMIGR
jgi:hypothetical protein